MTRFELETAIRDALVESGCQENLSCSMVTTFVVWPRIQRLQDESRELRYQEAWQRARAERSEQALEEWKVKYIVATNPGIDEAEVRRLRAGTSDGT